MRHTTRPAAHIAPLDLSSLSSQEIVLRDGLLRLRSEGGDVLRRLSIEDIIDGIATTCLQWLSRSYPYRRDVVKHVMEETRMSEEIIEHSIDVELRNYDKRDLVSVLDAELGDHRCLDEFRHNPITGLSCRATGPDLLLHWFSSSIPALPALGLIRGLLLKSPAVGRVSRREQSFAPAFVASLSEALPGVEAAIWLLTWPPAMEGLLGILAEYVDAAVVYGNTKTCRTLRSALSPSVDVVTHDHKVGVTLVGREVLIPGALHDLAYDCAYDVVAFDQRACISSQVCLVEKGGLATPLDFARVLGEALQKQENLLPASYASLDERIASHLAVKEAAFRGTEVIEAGNATILFETEIDRAVPTASQRMLRVIEIDDIEKALPRVGFQGSLQNVALAVEHGRQGRISSLLASLGASRICRPGAMPHPSMKWHHDGIACLSRLVRWTDIEML